MRLVQITHDRWPRWATTLWMVAVPLVTVAVYFVAFRVGYYFDSLNLVYEGPRDQPFYYLFHPHRLVPYGYRPIADTLMFAIQSRWDLNPLPVHIVVLGGHVLLCWLIFMAIRWLGFSDRLAVLASFFMLVSQIHTGVLLKVDMLNQVLGSLFGLIAILLLLERGIWRYLGGLAAVALAVFSKETSLAFLPMVAMVVLLSNLRTFERRRAMVRSFWEFLPFVALAALYWVARNATVVSPPAFGTTPYSLAIGMPNLINAAMYVYAAFTPVSTVDTYLAWRTGAVWLLVTALVFTLAWMAIVARGVVLSEHRRLALLIALFGLFGMFPAVLMNKVSEQFVYNSMPFFAVVMALGVDRLLRDTSAWRRLVLPFAGLVLVSHVIAIQTKGQLMAASHELGTRLQDEIAKIGRSLAPAGSVWLVRPPEQPVVYSQYVLTPFHLIVPHHLAKLMGRKDVSLRFLTVDEYAASSPGPNTVVLTLEGNHLKRLYPPD